MSFTYEELTESYLRLLEQMRFLSERGFTWGPREGLNPPQRFIVMQGGTIEGKKLTKPKDESKPPSHER